MHVLRGEFLIDPVYLSAFPLETRQNDCMLAACSTTNDEMLPETNPTHLQIQRLLTDPRIS
jgi:hypothetical protein